MQPGGGEGQFYFTAGTPFDNTSDEFFAFDIGQFIVRSRSYLVESTVSDRHIVLEQTRITHAICSGTGNNIFRTIPPSSLETIEKISLKAILVTTIRFVLV
jgi:hypothetical protein